MENKWWEVSIDKLISILNGSLEDRVSKAFDIKYGNYDYKNDLRYISEHEFTNAIESFTKDIKPGSNVLVCGANSGYEIKFLGGNNITAIDISSTALSKLSDKHPHVKAVNANMNKLPFADETFDLYLNLRSIQSRAVDLQKSVDEAFRVTKHSGLIVISIPNGYYNNGEIYRGLWDSNTQSLNAEKPVTLANEIKAIFENKSANNIGMKITNSEVFISCTK